MTQTRSRVRLGLIGGLLVRHGSAPIALAPGVQRMIAFLALSERPLLRGYVAGSLWADSTDDRAGANLRSALWRLHRLGLPVVQATPTHLCIDPRVEVDLREQTRRARDLLGGGGAPRGGHVEGLCALGEVLPDWYDDWAVIPRERFRQLRVHALEAACQRLIEEGRFGLALQAALAAVEVEPLRESAHRAVIRAHLAEGNLVEARRHHRLACELIESRLGVEPSEGLRRLVPPAPAEASA